MNAPPITIRTIQGDITKLDVDGIVNAANSGLRGGGGVDGAIHRAGGPAIARECAQIGGCPTGGAVVTSGGNLPARYVIHAVGPVWQGGNGDEDELLRSAYRSALARAREKKVKRLAFPNISTGIYGFPKKRAATIAIETVQSEAAACGLEEVIFCCFDPENFGIYTALLTK